ncbi:MAG: hypothetical protein E7282_10305 [Lachnospiraceae bacterium]|nr:hypothetical protein [Lachnospiraceae bacterium]
MSENGPIYLGIDFNDKSAMISYFKPNMDEPETVSTVAGSEAFSIPVILAKRKNLGMWYYGEEAVKMAKSSDLVCVDALLRRALAGEQIHIDDEVYDAEELLALFIKKLIQLTQRLGTINGFDKLVLCVERLSRDNMDLFWRIAGKLGLTKDQFMVIDHRESFYYYTFQQDERLWNRDVFLYCYERDLLYSYHLKRDMRTKPQVVTIIESQKKNLSGDKDLEFLRILNKSFENLIVSSVFLVGDGFEGDWMNQSLNFLCRGRRAFMGNNLFSKGACYAAATTALESWPFIYMGENEMKFNVSLKMKNRGNVEFYNLISAGKNWFEIEGECEVILSGTPEIDFWKQLPRSREASIETLELTDLPMRPDKTSRLRITAKPISVDKVEIEIKDLGFGEIFRGTDKNWKYTMTM